MDTTETLKPSTPASSTPAAPSRRRRSFIKPLCVIAAAAVVIVFSDGYLRKQQELVDRIARDDVPVMMPTRDLLRERVQARREWGVLSAAVEKARLALQQPATMPATMPADPKAKPPLPPQEQFLKASTELADFLGKQLGVDDELRQLALLDLVQTLPDDPGSLQGYFDLLLPAWTEKLGPRYPAFIERMEKILAGKNAVDQLQLSTQLAEALRMTGSRELELKTLLKIRGQFTVRFRTYLAMRRLSEILPADHPDSARLKREIDQYGQRRDLLITQAQAYTLFEALRAKNDMSGMLTWIEQQPQVTDPFGASAVAVVADSLARMGKIAKAREIRSRLLNYDLQDLDEATAVMDFTTPDRVTNQRRPISLPDSFTVTFQKWRALLDAGQIDAARALLALDASVENPKWFNEFSESEVTIAQGEATKLKPSAVLSTSDSASAAVIELQPQGAAVDASVHCRIKVQVTATHLIFTVNAEESRKPLPPCKITKRDEEVTRDESIEFIFMPDRSPDLMYRLAFNTDRAVLDARLTGSLLGGSMTVNKAVDLRATIESIPVDSGWSMRATVPRELIFPAEQSVIRFNARRFRNVSVGKSSVQQIYTWVPGKDMQVRPEQSGWLILSEAH